MAVWDRDGGRSSSKPRDASTLTTYPALYNVSAAVRCSIHLTEFLNVADLSGVEERVTIMFSA